MRLLKNQGIPFTTISLTMPSSLVKELKKDSRVILKKQLGLLKLLKVVYLRHRINKKLQKNPLTYVRSKGLQDVDFIEKQRNNAAMYIALKSVVGEDEAIDILQEITEAIAPRAMDFMFPSTAEFVETGDFFERFKEYFVQAYAANKEAGLHDFEVKENNETTFQINVTYCAYAAIAKELGVPKAAIPSCYADEIFFPERTEPLSVKFIRTSTLGRGGCCCDFCFKLEK